MNQQRDTSRPKVAWVIVPLILLGVAVLFAAPSFFRLKGHIHNVNPAGTVRTLTTAELVYAETYPRVGYAPDLAALGLPEDRALSAARSGIVDSRLGCSGGIGQGWRTKDWYRYNIQSSSRSAPYQDFWITATPLDVKSLEVERRWTDWLLRRPVQKSKPLRNFCALPDGYVRGEEAPPLKTPYTKSECERLPLLGDVVEHN
jgi:hypothetical protein